MAGHEGRAAAALAAPLLGSGLTLRTLELLAYEALADHAPATPEALAEAMAAIMAGRGDGLEKDGVPIPDTGEALRHLCGEAATLLADSVPIWRRVGLL